MSFFYFSALQYPQINTPIVNDMANYGTVTVPSLDATNNLTTLANLAALNNLQNNPMNDNLLLLINALSCMKVTGDIAQNGLLQQQQQQLHTCGLNAPMDCNASTIETTGCTKKYQKSPIPPDYMCHLCFSKDHFIRDCPQVNGSICLLINWINRTLNYNLSFSFGCDLI